MSRGPAVRPSLRATAAVLLGLLGAVAVSDPAPAGPVDHRPATATVAVNRVLVVSIDGLNPSAIDALGEKRAPTLHQLIAEGASTLNARTEREETETLPNHTSMVTGRRVSADKQGHGVWWDDDRLVPETVADAAGHRLSSVFSVVHRAKLGTAMFVSKPKLELFTRSWPRAIDRAVVEGHNASLVEEVRTDLLRHKRAFTFVHLSRPDLVGHQKGYLSRAYYQAVAETDELLATLVSTIEEHRRLDRHLVLVVTSDHGGRGYRHNDETKLVNYRIPFIVWGAGVDQGTDLYALNPGYADPGKARTRYSDPLQPIRNGAVANLATDLLGLSVVPGSLFDSAQDLAVTSTRTGAAAAAPRQGRRRRTGCSPTSRRGPGRSSPRTGPRPT